MSAFPSGDWMFPMVSVFCMLAGLCQTHGSGIGYGVTEVPAPIANVSSERESVAVPAGTETGTPAVDLAAAVIGSENQN